MGKAPLGVSGILSLPLFKTWVLFVDDVQFTLTANDLAINATLFYGCSYFHELCFLYYLFFFRFNTPPCCQKP